jgi:hypothetical protein
MGGNALRTYQDAEASGTLITYGDLGSKNLKTRIWTRGLDEFRMDFEKDGTIDTYVSDAETSCINRAGSEPHKTANFTANSQRVDLIPALSLLSRHQEAKLSVEYAGEATVNGKTSDVIVLSYELDAQLLAQRVDSKNAARRAFYIDKETGVVTKIAFFSVSEGNLTDKMLVEAYFSNYQAINGIAIPFSRSLFINKRHASDLTVDSVTFNTGMSDSIFSLSCGD